MAHFRHGVCSWYLEPMFDWVETLRLLFPFTAPLIFTRLAITLSQREFLQLFGVGRDYQMAIDAAASIARQR
jgi:hypothetical protein